jgi:hypothetical protein
VVEALWLVEPRGFEPLASCMPSMRGRFTAPRTPRRRTIAEVNCAVAVGILGRGAVACGAVSGNFLARPYMAVQGTDAGAITPEP